MAVSTAASAVADPNVQAGMAAAGYSFNYGSSERSGEASTPNRLPAALKFVEQITRPLSAEEALRSPAVAHGIAALLPLTMALSAAPRTSMLRAVGLAWMPHQTAPSYHS